MDSDMNSRRRRHPHPRDVPQLLYAIVLLIMLLLLAASPSPAQQEIQPEGTMGDTPANEISTGNLRPPADDAADATAEPDEVRDAPTQPGMPVPETGPMGDQLAPPAPPRQPRRTPAGPLWQRFLGTAALFAAVGLVLAVAWRRLGSNKAGIPPVFFDDNAERIAIFGDIHGNLPALEAVLADIREQGIAQCVCTGDIVGYGARPNACVDRVRKLTCPTVIGNHDRYSCDSDELVRFNPEAAKSVFWTRGRLTAANKAWLSALPYSHLLGDFTLVHAALNDPDQWPYLLHADDAARSFEHQETSLCFVGHSHVPCAFVLRDGDAEELPAESVTFDPALRYVVNVGSVGQPRDGNPDACYGVYNVAERTLVLRRVPYGLAAAQEEIREVGLPSKNADRLAIAR